MKEIDWKAQWELHAPNFREGFVHLQVGEMAVRLEPGPGFGDLSHPTTRLMLELMPPHVEGKTVLDIGCGSGILSVCAMAMGAKEVFAIDIDPPALEHSKRNAKLNGFSSKIHCSLAKDCFVEGEIIGLMNMIRIEQEAAWNSISNLQNQIVKLITSGVLHEERQLYRDQLTRGGWKIKQELLQDSWLGFLSEHDK